MTVDYCDTSVHRMYIVQETLNESVGIQPIYGANEQSKQQPKTRSHPEMVGDMSRVTLNFDLSKIPFVHF